VLAPAPVDPAVARAAAARRRSAEALGAIRESRRRSKRQAMLEQSVARTSNALDGARAALDRVVNTATVRASDPAVPRREPEAGRALPSPMSIALIATSAIMALIALTPIGGLAGLRRLRAGLAGLSTICLIAAMAVFLRA
jgi:hypothetical protein